MCIKEYSDLSILRQNINEATRLFRNPSPTHGSKVDSTEKENEPLFNDPELFNMISYSKR
jgi:hypothetical protein